MIVDYKNLKQAALNKAVKNGEIIIFPSNGTYLIGCSIENLDNMEKIRGFGMNFLIPGSKQWINLNLKSKKSYVKEIPGPFVYIFDAKKKSKFKFNAVLNAVSIPEHPVTKKIQKTGKIMFVSNLNLKRIRSINKDIRSLAGLIIDGGFLEGESFTVIDLREKIAKIVR